MWGPCPGRWCNASSPQALVTLWSSLTRSTSWVAVCSPIQTGCAAPAVLHALLRSSVHDVRCDVRAACCVVPRCACYAACHAVFILCMLRTLRCVLCCAALHAMICVLCCVSCCACFAILAVCPAVLCCLCGSALLLVDRA